MDEIPILMGPEMLFSNKSLRNFDLSEDKYKEAYEEMEFYNKVAEDEVRDIEQSNLGKLIDPILQLPEEEHSSFPFPEEVWLDAIYDSAAQRDSYCHIAPVTGKRILQCGGTGLHAVKFLLAGASEAWLLSPMLKELEFAKSLAHHYGVGNRLRCVAGLAEEIPFADASFDVVFSGGCVHHTVTSLAFPECARVLCSGGRFGAFEPWRAPLYSIGIKVFGKREVEVNCKPLTKQRVDSLFVAFSKAYIVHHGAFTRYPLIVLNKLGIRASLSTVLNLTKVDDSISSLVPFLNQMGSSVALLAEK